MNVRGKAARTALRLSNETYGLEWDGRPVVGPDRLLKRLQEVHGSEITASPTGHGHPTRKEPVLEP